MTVSTRTELLADAQDIYDETGDKLNTANRVGQMFIDIIDSSTLSAEYPKATAVATSNIATLSGTGETQDGVALNTVGDVCHCTGQSSADENGPWVVQSGPWTRPDWFASGIDAGGFMVRVTEGTVYADTLWECTTDDPNAVVDTNNLAWQMLGAGTVNASRAGLTPAVNATAGAMAYSTGSAMAWTAEILAVDAGSSHWRQLAFGTAPAAAGDLRWSAAFTLAAKISGTDYNWTFGATTLTLPEHSGGDYYLEPVVRASTGTGMAFTVAGGQANGTSDPGGIGKFVSGDPAASGTQPPGNYIYGCGKTWATGHDRGFAGIIEPPAVAITSARSYEFRKSARYTSVGTSLVAAWTLSRTSIVPPPATTTYFVLKYRWTILSWTTSGTSLTGAFWREGSIKVWNDTSPGLVIFEGDTPPEFSGSNNPNTLGCGVDSVAAAPTMVVNSDAIEFRLTPKVIGTQFELILECLGLYVPPS